YAYIYVQPMNQDMWRDFATAIGREELLADPRCADARSRWQHRDALNAVVREWTGARTKQEVMATLGKAGVPCGATLDTGEILDDPHLNARGQVHTIEHPTRGKIRLPGCPVRLSASEAPTTPPPLAGQHTDEVLAEVLGLSGDDVAALRARGVLGWARRAPRRRSGAAVHHAPPHHGEAHAHLSQRLQRRRQRILLEHGQVCAAPRRQAPRHAFALGDPRAAPRQGPERPPP